MSRMLQDPGQFPLCLTAPQPLIPQGPHLLEIQSEHRDSDGKRPRMTSDIFVCVPVRLGVDKSNEPDHSPELVTRLHVHITEHTGACTVAALHAWPCCQFKSGLGARRR